MSTFLKSDNLNRLAQILASTDEVPDTSFVDALLDGHEETSIEAKWPAKPDMLVPNFDRSGRTGSFAVVWLSQDGPIVSDRCTDANKARSLAATHRRMPTWIVKGTEEQLNAFLLSLDNRDARGFTAQTLDSELRSVLEIKATLNQTHSKRD